MKIRLLTIYVLALSLALTFLPEVPAGITGFQAPDLDSLSTQIEVGVLSPDIKITNRPVAGTGDFNGDQLGASIASGDVDGDGVDDIIIGARSADGPGNAFINAGEIYIFLGSKHLTSGARFEISKHQQDLTLFIKQVSAGLLSWSGKAFDFNGDGAHEILFTRHLDLPPPPPDVIRFPEEEIFLGGSLRPPQITKAKFKSSASELQVSGKEFTGAVQVEINGPLIVSEAQFLFEKGQLVLKGKKRELNLRSGKNQIAVIRKGLRSNTLTFKP